MQKEIGKPLSILIKFGHNIKFWKPGTNYRNHYILKKGGGIILDDSHEYDYLGWLFDDEIKSVYCQTQKTNSIKTETESFASMILKTKKGLIDAYKDIIPTLLKQKEDPSYHLTLSLPNEQKI